LHNIKRLCIVLVKVIANAQDFASVEHVNVCLLHLLCGKQLDGEKLELFARERLDQGWKRHVNKTMENAKQRLSPVKRTVV
jgi:hypothetical protein